MQPLTLRGALALRPNILPRMVPPGSGGRAASAWPRRPLFLVLAALAVTGCANLAETRTNVVGVNYFEPRTTLSGDYLAARHAGKIQDTAAAAEFYARALDKRPNDRAILERAFLLDLSSGRIKSAVALAERIAERRSEDRLARMVLAIDAMRDGSYGVARGHVLAAGKGPLTDIINQLIGAWALAGSGQTDEAIARLGKLGGGRGLDLYRAYHAALIHDLANDRRRAEEAYEKSMAISDGASLRVVQAYGRFLERDGRRDEAIGIYRRFLDEIGAHPLVRAALRRAETSDQAPARLVASARAGTAEAIYALAGALIREEDRAYDLPIVYLHLTLYLRGDFPVAQSLLAEVLATAGRYEMAAAVYRKVPRSSPLWINSRIQIASGLSRLEQREEAIETLMDVIDVAPNNIDVLASIGDLFLSAENYSAAADYFARALEQVEGAPNQTHWALYHQYGIALERSKRWPEAEAALKTALELRPNQPFVLNYLGYSWIDRGINLDEAMQMITTAVALEPDNGFIIDSLGWGLYRLGDYDGAVEKLEQAVALEPGDPVINDHLGDAYWRVGRRIEARFQWNHALRLEPEPKLEETVREKIKYGLDADEATLAGADS